MRIAICGAGTLGAHLAEHLARLGRDDLAVIDKDAVESGNLTAQPYCRQDVGRPKAAALSEMLYRAVGARVAAVKKALTSANAARLLDGYDLVVDAFDNRAARDAVQRATRALGTLCLHLGISDDGYGESVWDEDYEVPEDQPRDACPLPHARSLALLVVAAAAASIESRRDGRRPLSLTVTASDLSIRERPRAS